MVSNTNYNECQGKNSVSSPVLLFFVNLFISLLSERHYYFLSFSTLWKKKFARIWNYLTQDKENEQRDILWIGKGRIKPNGIRNGGVVQIKLNNGGINIFIVRFVLYMQSRYFTLLCIFSIKRLFMLQNYNLLQF